MGVPDPANDPPESRGEGTRGVIIGYDPAVVVYADAPEKRQKLLAIGQRMPAGLRQNGSGEIVIEVGEVRSRYVTRLVGPAPGRRIRQVESAVDHDQRRVAGHAGKLVGGYEWFVVRTFAHSRCHSRRTGCRSISK